MSVCANDPRLERFSRHSFWDITYSTYTGCYLNNQLRRWYSSDKELRACVEQMPFWASFIRGRYLCLVARVGCTCVQAA